MNHFLYEFEVPSEDNVIRCAGVPLLIPACFQAARVARLHDKPWRAAASVACCSHSIDSESASGVRRAAAERFAWNASRATLAM